MNKINIFLFSMVTILGILMGGIVASKDIKIEKLTKENNELKEELINFKWQLDQVPYIIESWCNGE